MSGVPHATLIELAQHSITNTDGLITVSASAFDGDAVDATKQWLASLGKVSYNIAPLSFPSPHQGISTTPENVSNFLNTMQTQFGESSVIYVCAELNFL